MSVLQIPELEGPTPFRMFASKGRYSYGHQAEKGPEEASLQTKEWRTKMMMIAVWRIT